MSKPPLKNLPIPKLITHYLIPWTQQSVTSHIVIMPARDKTLPLGVKVQKSTFAGPRIPVKNLREAGHMSVNTAKWPEDGLSEKNVPFLLCVIAGCANIQIGSQLLTCSEGNFVFIPPGLAHPDGTRPYSTQDTACSIFWMRRCGRGLRGWISHSRNKQNIRPRHGESAYFYHEQVTQVFDALCEELLAHRTGDLCNHALMLFCI